MAVHPVSIEVDFEDAAERTTTITYMLRDTFDDAAVDNEWNDIIAAADLLITALQVLTMSATLTYRLVFPVATGGLSANVAANNQVAAFTRINDSAGNKSSFEVPAWDDVAFDENSQNVLSDAYDTAAAAVALLLKAPETENNFALSPEYSQSRTRKSRNIIHD